MPRRAARSRSPSWSGYGATADASHITLPAPGGIGAVRAARRALEKAGLTPADIDHVNAHATSTPEGDKAELQAIRTIFGDDAGRVAVTANKSMLGHTLGAAGAIEAIATIMAIRDGCVPPTINLIDPDPAAEGLDLTPNVARAARSGPRSATRSGSAARTRPSSSRGGRDDGRRPRARRAERRGRRPIEPRTAGRRARPAGRAADPARPRRRRAARAHRPPGRPARPVRPDRARGRGRRDRTRPAQAVGRSRRPAATAPAAGRGDRRRPRPRPASRPRPAATRRPSPGHRSRRR